MSNDNFLEQVQQRFKIAEERINTEGERIDIASGRIDRLGGLASIAFWLIAVLCLTSGAALATAILAHFK